MRARAPESTQELELERVRAESIRGRHRAAKARLAYHYSRFPLSNLSRSMCSSTMCDRVGGFAMRFKVEGLHHVILPQGQSLVSLD